MRLRSFSISRSTRDNLGHYPMVLSESAEFVGTPGAQKLKLSRCGEKILMLIGLLPARDSFQPFRLPAGRFRSELLREQWKRPLCPGNPGLQKSR